MIINHITDNDLYKFSVMLAIQKLYPRVLVRYQFFSRNETDFPDGFADALRQEVASMAQLRLTRQEKQFIRKRCYFFDPVFIDFLEGYRYDPDEVKIEQKGGRLEVFIEGYWYRTVLWEVPLLAIISELYFKMTGVVPHEVEEKAVAKAKAMRDLQADYSDMGTRRRFSFDVHDRVVAALQANSGEHFKGTSNVYLAMKYDTTPIGTMPHEWFMFHGAMFGYRAANEKALEAWVNVFQGSLGITLTDTYTSESFFNSFNLKLAKLFDGVRCDSGDPITFTDEIICFYKANRIDPKSKTVVFSDALRLEDVRRIKKYVNSAVHDTYGIGTFLSNDVGARPLNIVIKLTHAKNNLQDKYLATVKLSDSAGKNTGEENEIRICKLTLGIE